MPIARTPTSHSPLVNAALDPAAGGSRKRLDNHVEQDRDQDDVIDDRGGSHPWLQKQLRDLAAQRAVWSALQQNVQADREGAIDSYSDSHEHQPAQVS